MGAAGVGIVDRRYGTNRGTPGRDEAASHRTSVAGAVQVDQDITRREGEDESVLTGGTEALLRKIRGQLGEQPVTEGVARIVGTLSSDVRVLIVGGHRGVGDVELPENGSGPDALIGLGKRGRIFRRDGVIDVEQSMVGEVASEIVPI